MYPCIRNLDQFKKKGCPQKSWNGKEGCPCWIELTISERGNPLKKEIKKQCLDLWFFDFQWAMMGLLEGNQQATESFRNGMTETKNGTIYPKPDPAMVAVLNFFQNLKKEKRIIFEHESKKALEQNEYIE